MSKYDLLGSYLKGQPATEIPMTFAEIERVTGTKLPPSAYRHRPWWSNNASNSVMTKVWLNAGYHAERVDMAAKRLVFKRVLPPSQPGLAEEGRVFHHDKQSAKPRRRHPAFGSMKGTFTIEPGYDLTSPMFSDREWKEIEREMEQDWAQIEQGMTGKMKTEDK